MHESSTTALWRAGVCGIFVFLGLQSITVWLTAMIDSSSYSFGSGAPVVTTWLAVLILLAGVSSVAAGIGYYIKE